MNGSAVRFTTSASVVLAGGTGTIRLAPAGEKWQIDRTYVKCSTRVSEAQCVTYIGQVADQYIVDGTYSGSSGDTSDTVLYLEDGQGMHLVWTGGDDGATATVTISGWKSPPLGGFRAIH